MSFTIKRTLPYNLNFYEIGAEVTGGNQELNLTYTATGINYGGKTVGADAEIVFSITCDTPAIATNTTLLIEVNSVDSEAILSQAEAELQSSLS